MPKASKPGYYAVRRGRVPAIYPSWAECEAQIKGFPGAVYKKLSTEAEAVEFMAASASHDTAPVPSTTRATARPNTRAPEDENDCDIVYCDGACRGNGQQGSIAGIGVWWGHDDPRNISERCPGVQTNNRAELIAIVRILETTPHLKRRLLIKTDSNYSIQCVTSWIFNWMRNGFLASNGQPIKNRALIKYLAALLHARRKTSQTVELKHVPGHVGIQGNEAADRLANIGATKSTAPEPDWERLEKQVLQSLEPVMPVKVASDDLKAYADSLLNDDELVELADTSANDVTSPERGLRRRHLENGEHVPQPHTFVSPAPHGDSLQRLGAARLVTSKPSDRMATVHNRSRLPFEGPSKSTATSAPDRKPVIAMSEEESKAYASCLLGDEELSTLGVDGVFDSDF